MHTRRVNAWFDLVVGDRSSTRIVQAPSVAQQRRIAARAHVGEDARDGLAQLRVGRRLVARQSGELRFEAAIGRRESPQFHARAACAKASIKGCSATRLVLSAAWLTMRRADTGM